MISDKIVPAHILRLYVWEILKANTSMTTVNGLVPIVPIEDEPKLADSGKPYIVYGYAETEARVMDEIRQGIVSFRITTPDFGLLGEITNVIATAFESRDFATEAVNRWSNQYPEGALRGIRFMEVKTTYVEQGEPARTEGGPVDTVVNVSFRYITDLEVTHPTAALGGLWT